MPLCTIRRVERLNARAGIYALSLSLHTGAKIVSRIHIVRTSTRILTSTSQVVQLTSLRPSADLFCSLLRDALKAELQRGQMKAVKGFVKTCYSEVLVSAGTGPAEEKDASKTDSTVDSATESSYLGGLGLKFKFPGDPRKCVVRSLRVSCPIDDDGPRRLREASKTKLWTVYLKSMSYICCLIARH